jgi:hypothetical protein
MEPEGDQFHKPGLGLVFPVSVGHFLPAQVVQGAVSALLRCDGHEIRGPIVRHLGRNFRRAQAKELNFKLANLRRRSGTRRREFGSNNC